MLRAATTLLAGFSAAGFLLLSSPALACNGDCGCPHHRQAQQKDADSANVLAPVDQLLSDKCNCDGPSECTCKKGECKCKKCSQHQHADGVKKTQLLRPLRGAPASPAIPENARLDASAGVFI